MEEYKGITITELKFKENLCNALIHNYKRVEEFVENPYNSFIPFAFRNKIHNIRKVSNQRVRFHFCFKTKKESKMTS